MGPLWYFGSSPLARGLRARPVDGPAAGRIIPARAGFTQSTCQNQQSDTDHPRSRGVYCHYRGLLSGRWGSSPLARGLRRRPLRGLAGERIIPARAGFTPTRTGMTRSRPDHPRSRGVYINRRSDVVSERGSSPLARGLPLIAFSLAVPGGIIPARAGFTRARCRPGSRPADHPRSRGVYSLAPGSFPTPMGSSPLARGLLVVPTPRWGVVGIIPARAGFTATHTMFRLPETDHPRSRGVYSYSTLNVT